MKHTGGQLQEYFLREIVSKREACRIDASVGVETPKAESFQRGSD